MSKSFNIILGLALMPLVVFCACLDNPHQADLDRAGVKSATGPPIVNVLPCTSRTTLNLILFESSEIFDSTELWPESFLVNIAFDYTVTVYEPMYFKNPLTEKSGTRVFPIEIKNINATVENVEDSVDMEIDGG